MIYGKDFSEVRRSEPKEKVYHRGSFRILKEYDFLSSTLLLYHVLWHNALAKKQKSPLVSGVR